jgi:membrane protease YdiL (CAAX protease family)
MPTEMRLDRTGSFTETPPFLALTGPKDRAWWRVLLTTLAGTGVAVAAMTLASIAVFVVAAITYLETVGLAGGMSAAIDLFLDPKVTQRDLVLSSVILAVTGAGFLAFAGVFLGLAAKIHGRAMRSFVTAARRFRWRMALAGLVIYAPLAGAALAIEALWDPPTMVAPVLAPVALGVRALYGLSALVFLFLAAWTEEVFFRGWMTQQIAAFTRNAAVIVGVQAVIFSLFHFDPNIDAFVMRAAMGAALAWISVRTDGLEMAAGAHTANNLMIALFIEPMTLAEYGPQPFDGAAMAVELVVMAALVGAVELVMRRPRLARLAGVSRVAAA